MNALSLHPSLRKHCENSDILTHHATAHHNVYTTYYPTPSSTIQETSQSANETLQHRYKPNTLIQIPTSNRPHPSIQSSITLLTMCQTNLDYFSACKHTVTNFKLPFDRCITVRRTLLQKPCSVAKKGVTKHEGHCGHCTVALIRKLESLKRMQDKGWEWTPAEKDVYVREREGV